MTKHRSHGAAFKRQVTWGLIPKAPLINSWRGSPAARFLTLGAGDSRHTISCEIARRLFGGRASHARRSKDVSQSRHLLSLAAVRDGMDRAAVAKIGSMDRQRLRDWVHRFNASGRHRQPHGKAAMGWAGAPRFGNAVAYPFFHSPTFCRHSKVAVSGRGTSTVVRNCKDVSPTGDDYAEERTQRGCRAS